MTQESGAATAEGEKEDGGKITMNRKQKQKAKDSKKITKLVSLPQSEARGHTGYLTFATKF